MIAVIAPALVYCVVNIVWNWWDDWQIAKAIEAERETMKRRIGL